ncbi:class I SAM-dependent methyltransferase [Streptomyces sp. NPDC001667]
MRRDVEQFERWAATYDDSLLQERYFRPVQRALLRHATAVEPDPSRILDIGCGTGALLRQVRTHFPRAAATGVDPASSMVRRAAVDGGAYVVGRAEQLPFPDASFPLVLSTLSFHHWADQGRGLAEVSRVLRPGGHVLIADHFATGWLRAVFAAVRKRGRIRTHGEADAMLRSAGLTPLGWHVALTVAGFLRAGEGSGPLPLAALCVARKPSVG